MLAENDRIQDENRWGLARRDGWPLAFLLTAGLILAWPILTGGWLTYLDNPAHIAEIHSLAFDQGGGWSDLAWCGYPLGRLHSPVWFGGMAFLHRLGIPLGPMYASSILLGFFAPLLVIYLLARRWTSPGIAAGLAWLLMVQRTALVGFGTALGGMWTFYLATAAVILLIQLLAKRKDRGSDLLGIAVLFGFLGLTHLFAIVPAMIVFALHLLVQVVGGNRRRFLVIQGAAAGIGALASAAYWAPLALAGEGVQISPLNLHPGHLMARLFLPMRMPDLLTDSLNYAGDLYFLEAVPPVVLVILGVLGMRVYRRRQTPSRLPLYGFLLATTLILLLLAVGILTEFGHPVTWLGHVSWRLLYFVRVGFALAALPLLTEMAPRLGTLLSPKPRWILAGGALLLFAYGFGLPLRRECLSPRSPQMQEVRQVWRWLKDHRTPAWGRVYLQDPFHGGRGEGAPLANSHVMAMTAMNTGIRQLGPLYGGSPFPNVSWLLGESGRIFGRPLRNDNQLERLLAMMSLSNVTTLVLHHPDLATKLIGTNLFGPVFQTENFSILAPLPAARSRWVDSLSEGLTVSGGPVSPGLWKMKLQADDAGGAVLLKTSWSPHWTVIQPPGTELDVNNSGLVEVTGLPAGNSQLTVKFDPPRWPDVLSIATWLLLGMAWVFRNSWTGRIRVDSRG